MSDEKSRLVACERTLDAMREAFNVNHKSYAGAIGALDGHLAVMRAVVNDIHRGEVTTDADGNISWDTYFDWYNQHVEACQKEEAEKANATGLIDTTARVPEEQVFGGDYGNGS